MITSRLFHRSVRVVLDHRREITGMARSVVDERFSTRVAEERVDLWTLNLLSFDSYSLAAVTESQLSVMVNSLSRR